MNILALLAGLFSGIIGSMGLGGGAVLIIYLSLFTNTEHLTSQGINLLFFIPIASVAVAVYSYRKKIKWKITLKLAFWGILGTCLGLVFADLLGSTLVSKLFGAMLILLGFKEIFHKNKKELPNKESDDILKKE